jgi:hypothetical protein
MKEQIIQIVVQMLQNNLNNRITPELATGIATSIDRLLSQVDITEKVPDTEAGA